VNEENNDLIKRLQHFQKRVKYGLPTENAITIYELGFSDRIVAQELGASITITSVHKTGVISGIRSQKEAVLSILYKYPRYFHTKLDNLVTHSSPPLLS